MEISFGLAGYRASLKKTGVAFDPQFVCYAQGDTLYAPLNRIVKQGATAVDAFRSLGWPAREVYAEAFVDYARELASLVVRSAADVFFFVALTALTAATIRLPRGALGLGTRGSGTGDGKTWGA